MKQKNNTTLAAEHVAWLRAFADAKGGISQAANFLGLSRNALTRAMAALPIHRGTAVILAKGIEERRDEKTP